MNIAEAEKRLRLALAGIYDAREAANISALAMENLTGRSRIDRIGHREEELSVEMKQKFDRYCHSLGGGIPVQYVLHEAWFLGLPFYVDPRVLIPRPETEELVMWAIGDCAARSGDGMSIIDIGTGSGCIAVALDKKLPGWIVYGCDISEGALEVAKKNASMHNTSIHLLQCDIMDQTMWPGLPGIDVIVSNPPYISPAEKSEMKPNVLDHEPHVALFTSSPDGLEFYRALAGFASFTFGGRAGVIYAETHASRTEATAAIFWASGCRSVETRTDMQGNMRMVKAVY